MAIKPICDRCKRELEDFGGILFSPPNPDKTTKKLHICKKCYEEILKEFDEPQ